MGRSQSAISCVPFANVGTDAIPLRVLPEVKSGKAVIEFELGIGNGFAI